MTKHYDVIVAGAGVAGALAIQELSKNSKLKCAVVEFGRPPGKRRKQLEGWFGCFISSNARLYLGDLNKVRNICGAKITNNAYKSVIKELSLYGNCKVEKNKEPTEKAKKRLIDNKYKIIMNDYIQWKPENVHAMAKGISDNIENNSNIDFYFDFEIKELVKCGKNFEMLIEEDAGEDKKEIIIKGTNVIWAVGRSGWRLTNNIFKNLGIYNRNDYSYYGFRAEMASSHMKEFNDSHCSFKKNNLLIGELNWRGSVIQEDHCDLIISGFRSNEDRWKTDKVSFSVINKVLNKNNGAEQTERLGKLACVLFDDGQGRVGKIKGSDFINVKCDLKYIPEYDWVEDVINKISIIIPPFIEKSYLYFPDINTGSGVNGFNNDLKTDIDENFCSTKIPGLYVVGESTGSKGLIFALSSAIIASKQLI